MHANHSIVILWAGNNCPDEVIEAIANVIATSGVAIPELMTIQYKDQDGLAALLTKEAIAATQAKSENSIESALENAIKFIGIKYENELKVGNRVPLFAMKLQKDASDAYSMRGFNMLDPESNPRSLWKAIEIIATADGVIPPTLAKKYHFNNTVVSIIKHIYNEYQ